MKTDNISSIIEEDLCTGCGTCVALCPSDAISIEIDKRRGLYMPRIEKEKCTNCGICINICPGGEVDFGQLNLDVFNVNARDILIGNYINFYTGYALDRDIRYHSASGGLITSILIYLLERKIIDGALVTRMKKENPLEPEPFIAKTKEEVIEAARSKYCPVPANIALQKILDADEGQHFAVVGLPCHIHGLRKAQRINKILKERIILCLGIICNHVPTFRATEFLLKKNRIEEEKIKKLDYRGNGWPGGLCVELEKGERLSKIIHEYWACGFGTHFYPIRCTVCCDQTCELSDISFADAWLPELEKDKIGTSICVTRTHKAEALLLDMEQENRIEITEVNRQKLVQSQSTILTTRKKVKSRTTILKLMNRRIPNYNANLIEPKLTDYINSLILYLRIMISTKDYLWWWINLEGDAKIKVMRYIKNNDKILRVYRKYISKKY